MLTIQFREVVAGLGDEVGDVWCGLELYLLRVYLTKAKNRCKCDVYHHVTKNIVRTTLWWFFSSRALSFALMQRCFVAKAAGTRVERIWSRLGKLLTPTWKSLKSSWFIKLVYITLRTHLLSEEGYLDELGVSGIKTPTSYSNVFEKADACRGHHRRRFWRHCWSVWRFWWDGRLPSMIVYMTRGNLEKKDSSAHLWRSQTNLIAL